MWQASDWQGALAQPRKAVLGSVPAEWTPRSWFGTAHVATNQIGPSCVGMAVANWVEHKLGSRLDKRTQIDGYAIWRRGRDMFWNGTYNDGLYLYQGVAAAVSLGILPKTAKYREVLSATAWNADLEKQPLIQAHWVHDGWNKPDTASGCIDHQYGPSNNQGGHCTLMIGMGLHSGKNFVFSQNSWGATWGRLGFFCMTVEEHVENSASDVLAIDIPDGEWEAWTGWKNYVT